MLAAALFFTGVGAHAEGDGLSKEDKACLSCHDKEGVTKTLGNGEQLSLYISTKSYLASMHKDTSCEDCHSDIDAKTHGKVKTALGSRRELALSMKDSCVTCHKKKATEYADSVHAAMVKEGSETAPLCADCHSPHTLRSVKEVAPIAQTPCAKCHDEIFKAYAADVHGQERAAKGKIAPLCSDCHQAHAVKAASLGTGVRDACLGCHKDAVDLHRDWLPNTGLHFEAISCPACHAPGGERRVNLRLYDNKEKRQLAEKTGVPRFEKLVSAADVKATGLDERALWSLLKEFNGDGIEGNTILRGRLEVRTGAQAHQIAVKSQAIRECDTCHSAGASPFQSVTLTIAGADGRPLRHGVEKDVLSSLTSMDSVRGFYAIGATRIRLLDHLLLLVVLGAACVPLAHMTIRWMFRRFRAKLDAERTAVSAEAARPQPNGDRADSDVDSK
jgi:predicted CXXCH cytochrome family protein